MTDREKLAGDDRKIVADTMREMQAHIERLTGARHSCYDGAVGIARDMAAPAPTEREELRLALMQARYVLRDLHAKNGGCGYDKLATACERASDLLSALQGEDKT